MIEEKRIAFLCHPYHRGGVTRWMADAAREASSIGYETYFITVEPRSRFNSAGTRETMIELLKTGGSATKVFSTKVGYEFEFGTEEYRAAVYGGLVKAHVPVGTPVIVSDDSAVWKGAASVADTHPMVGVLHCDDKYYYNIGKEYSEQMSVCVCVSKRVKRVFTEQCPGYDKAKVFDIPCGIELHKFAPHKRERDLTRLVFIGRFNDHQKRAQDLVEICGKLKDDGFKFHLDIAGNDEPSKQEYEGRFGQRGVGEHVTFHGWQSAKEVETLLNNSDVLLLTSNFEGTPLVMMEALTAGCGFVGTRVSGVEDYEHHPRAGDCLAVYAIGDTEDAVTKIKKVAAIPAATRQRAARILAEEEFTMEVCLRKYFGAIENSARVAVSRREINLPLIASISSRMLALARKLKVLMTKS